MTTLTKAEEQVMKVLWKKEKALLRELVAAMPSPKPHTNTVATILKILVQKEFVTIEVIGRIHQYHPIILKEQYAKRRVKNLVKGYFEGSFTDAVSFMVQEKDISLADLELLLETLKKNKK